MNNASTHQENSADGSFSAREYFLGIAREIMASRENAHIALPGKGEVYLFPRSEEYHANIPDMEDFCLTPASRFKVTVLGDARGEVAPGAGRHVSDLLWQAAFHASGGGLIEGCSKYDVVQFLRWPNLTRLPKTPNTMRICALLTRYPMTIMLVHRKLGIDKKELYQTYSAAYCAGLTNIVGRAGQDAAHDKVAETVAEEPAQQHNLFHSLFAKIKGL